jgi:hypothetical protein
MGRKNMTLKRRTAIEAEKVVAQIAPFTFDYEVPTGEPRGANVVTFVTGSVLFLFILLVFAVGIAALIRS